MKIASKLTGERISIPCYDSYDNAELALENKLELVEPEVMEIALESVRDHLELRERTSEIDSMLYYINEILLPNSKMGMYFVADRN